MPLALTRRTLAFAAASLAIPRIGQAASATVRIGYQKNGSLVLVRQQERLRKLNIAAEWVEFNSGPPILDANSCAEFS